MYLLHIGFLLGIFIILKMKMKFTSETSVEFLLAAGRYIPVIITLVTVVLWICANEMRMLTALFIVCSQQKMHYSSPFPTS
jgi:ABC-type nitrate/sulfonate/bicarbonate transport system permease component